MKIFNKKINLFIALALLCLINPTDTLAASCSGAKYACATCKYDITGKNGTNYGSVTYVIKSDGTKVSKALTTDLSSKYYVIDEDNLSSVNFVSDSTNKIKCPSSIAVGQYPGSGTNRNTYFDLNIKKCDSSKSQYYACSTIKLKKENNNDKTISDVDSDVISCKYTTSIINGQSSGTSITGVITINNGKINYEFTDGYRINPNVNEINAGMFTANSCPELYFSCGSSGSAKYCSYQLENVIRPGTEQEGEKNETADDLEKEENVKPEACAPEERYCGLFCDGTWNIIKSLYGIVKVLIPVLVVILGMIDFASVVFSGEDKDMKTAGQRFIKRIIVGVVLLLLPAILGFIFNLVGFSEGCLADLMK